MIMVGYVLYKTHHSFTGDTHTQTKKKNSVTVLYFGINCWKCVITCGMSFLA